MNPTRFKLSVLLLMLGASGSGTVHAQAMLPDGANTPATLAVVTRAGAAVRRLTLEEATQLALQNNKALNLARLNVDEKGHATKAARKDYLPKVVGIDSYFRFNDNLGSVITLQTGARGVLPPSARTLNASVFNQDTNLATVMVAQPITKLLAVNAAVQLARADEGTARAQLDKGTRDLVSGIAQTYHGLLGSQRIQTVLELQVSLLEQTITAKSIPELRIGLLETKQGLVQIRAQVRELTQQVVDLLDLPPGTQLELVDPLPANPSIHSADEAAEVAVRSNPEVREAQEGIAKAEAAMKMARMAYLPDVSVMGGYANQTGASYIQPNIGYLGLSGSYTFFEWGKKRDVKRQREVDMSMAQQNVQVTMDKVKLEARKAYGHFEQAREELTIAGEMVRLRKDVAKAATGPAALQAQADTSKAELEYMKAEISYRVAHAQLLGTIGS